MNEYEFNRVETSDGRFVYQFETANGIVYLVEFTPTGYVFENVPWADDCYEFSVRPRNALTRRVPYDAKTAPTCQCHFPLVL